MPRSASPLTHGGRVGFQVENALAAAGRRLGARRLDDTVIRAALASFTSDMPDRRRAGSTCCEVEARPSSSTSATTPRPSRPWSKRSSQFPHERRSIVFSADGDRRDEVIVRQAEILGAAFDHVILYEEHGCNRGRAAGEIIALFRRGLARLPPACPRCARSKAKRLPSKPHSAPWSSGDLLLILHDAVEKSLAFVQRYLAERDRNAARANGATADDAGSAPRGFREVRIVNQGH